MALAEEIQAESSHPPAVEIEMEELDIASSGVVIETAVSRRNSAAPVTPPSHVKHLNNVAVLIGISIMAYAGVALRMGLIDLFSFIHPKMFLYPVAWANFLGCLIMGIFSDHKPALAKFYAPLAVALQTGFCGSLTSFSTVMVSGVSLTFGIFSCNLSIGERAVAFLENYFFNFFVSFCFFLYGRQLSHHRFFERLFSTMLTTHYNDQSHRKHIFLGATFVIFYILFTLLFVLLCVLLPASQRYAMAIVFSQFGAVIRYYIGKKFNPCRPLFPIGTFCANILGTIISAVLSSSGKYLSDKFSDTPIFFIVLSALGNGFCGALTTVSTFVAEIALLPSISTSVRYALVTLLCAQFLAFVPYISFHLLIDSATQMYC